MVLFKFVYYTKKHQSELFIILLSRLIFLLLSAIPSDG